MRDDFGIGNIIPIKVAITYEQTQQLDLPEALEAKATSRNYAAFVKRYGTAAYELEAIPPEILQELLNDAILRVIDQTLFEAEMAQEREDAAYLAAVRQQIVRMLRDTRIGE